VRAVALQFLRLRLCHWGRGQDLFEFLRQNGQRTGYADKPADKQVLAG